MENTQCQECNKSLVRNQKRFCSRSCNSRRIGKQNKGKATRGTGWKHSEETKRKQSVSRKKYLATDEGKRQHTESMRGRTFSDAAKENIRVAQKKRWSKRGADWDRQMEHLKHIQSPTRIEDILVNVVLAEFPTVQREVSFGKYRVDAYLPPPYHLAFEADGVYWHRDPTPDIERDAWLLAERGLVVVRLTEAELLQL